MTRKALSKILCAAVLFASAFTLANAQSTTIVIPQMAYFDVSLAGLGGLYPSISEGYDSLWGNPAGYADENGVFGFGFDSWIYSKPDVDSVSTLFAALSGNNVLGTSGTLISENGIGFGGMFGIGYSGNNFGIGLCMRTDGYAGGLTPASASGFTDTIVEIVAGMSASFEAGGAVFKFGASLRPYYRMIGLIDSTIIESLYSNDLWTAVSATPSYAGFGLTADAGAIIEIGSLSLGLSVRDISTPLAFTQSTMGDVVLSFLEGSAPTGSNVGVITAPFISLGASWKPSFSALDDTVKFAFYAEIDDWLRVIRGGISPLSMLHLGANAELWGFLNLRIGLNGGYPVFGFGFDLSWISFDMAVFTEEAGTNFGDFPVTRIAVGLSFVF